MNEQCKSEHKGLRCDVIGKSPHTHHAYATKNAPEEVDTNIWWSDADEISELREWVREILEVNELRSGF